MFLKKINSLLLCTMCIPFPLYQSHTRQCEEYVRDHQTYQATVADCQEWLATIQERLDLCSDVTGDQHAVQNRLDRLEVGDRVTWAVSVTWAARVSRLSECLGLSG